MSNLIFFDMETGSVDPENGAIIQIAAIATDANLAEVDRFECKVKFRESEADPEALKINHYDAEVWEQSAQHPARAAQMLSEWLSGYRSIQMTSKRGKPYSVAQGVAYNAAFDGRFLQSWYRRLDQFLPMAFRTLCTMQRAMWYFHERPGIEQPDDFSSRTTSSWLPSVKFSGSISKAPTTRWPIPRPT